MSEIDKYGYYTLDYVEEQIDKQLEVIMQRDGGPDSKSSKELCIEVEKEKKHLHHFVKKLINLEHKILIFLDTPRMSLFEALMPLLSHDKYESEYRFVDTSGGLKTYKNLLCGWPCFIFAQAIAYSEYKRFPELQRRFIITNPTMDSKQKYAEAIDLIIKKNCLPDFMYQKLVVSDEQKDRAKEIIVYLCDKISKVCGNLEPGKNSMFVPYSDAIESGLSKEQTSDMTSAKRFTSFLSLLPMINVTKRPSLRVHTGKEDEDGPIIQTIPLATFEDLKEAMFLMHYSNGVRPYVLEWYYDVFLPTYKMHDGPAYKDKKVGKEEQRIFENRKAVTTAELIAATREKRNKSHTSKYLHEYFIYPLMNQGYVDGIESELDHRAKIYFPANEADSNIVFTAEMENRAYLFAGSKINITDVTMFPDKEYLTSRIEALLKYSSEIGAHAYISDSDDNEVPIEQTDNKLIDRYYKGPENYFEHFSKKEDTAITSTTTTNDTHTSRRRI